MYVAVYTDCKQDTGINEILQRTIKRTFEYFLMQKRPLWQMEIPLTLESFISHSFTWKVTFQVKSKWEMLNIFSSVKYIYISVTWGVLTLEPYTPIKTFCFISTNTIELLLPNLSFQVNVMFTLNGKTSKCQTKNANNYCCDIFLKYLFDADIFLSFLSNSRNISSQHCSETQILT